MASHMVVEGCHHGVNAGFALVCIEGMEYTPQGAAKADALKASLSQENPDEYFNIAHSHFAPGDYRGKNQECNI